MFFLGYVGFGQEKQPKDSVSQKKGTERKEIMEMEKSEDSTGLYNDIKKYSQKSGVFKQLYKWMFREPRLDDNHKKRIDQPDLTPYSDKIINEIEINSKDPFGYSITDEDREPHSWFEKVGNAIHIKSKNMAINKYFLFKEGEPVDTFLVNESARLLRQQSYVRDVRIEVLDSLTEGDSIGLNVKILDSWSMLPRVRISGSNTKVGLKERNFIGLGHELEFRYGKRYADGHSGFETSYRVPNLRNTFIDIEANYDVDFDYFYDRFVRVNRDFYSSITRWAGGAFFQERSLERPLPDMGMDFEDITLKYRYQDYWGGYAIPVFTNRTANINDRSNLIFSARALFLNYKRTPPEEYDWTDFFSDERFYLASIGLSSRKYVQDAFIFRDGETEDVPIGSYYAVTTGYQRKNHIGRLYVGLRASYGTYFNWGFLSTNIEAGSYFTQSHAQQGAVSLKANYFSNIWNLWGKWRMRQFVKPQIIIGFNRLPTPIDRLGLNEKAYFNGIHGEEYVDYDNHRRYIDYRTGGIEGFDSYAMGTQKYVVDFQTQFYAPWEFWGFHVNPFVNMSFGYMGGKTDSFKSNRVYSSFGLGVIIRNDYLVFNSFQLSFAYYPNMPGEGSSVIRTNAYKTEDFGFQDFQSSEPRTIIYE